MEGTPVYFEDFRDFHSWSAFTVNRWNTTCTVDGDPYGTVNPRGSVEVSGYLNRAVVVESCVDKDGESFILRADRGRTFKFTPDVVVEPAGDDVVRLGETLSCFEGGAHWFNRFIGLVLRKENSRRSASWPLIRETYRRIGRYEPDPSSSSEEADKGVGRELLWYLRHRSSWPYTITIV